MKKKLPEAGPLQRGASAALQLVLPLFGQVDAPEAPPRSRARRPRAADAEGSERIANIAGRELGYRLRRRQRRTIGFTIDQRGLVVSAPRWVSLREIDQAIAEKGAWIVQKLAEWDAYAARLEALECDWRDGAALTHLGESVLLTLDASGRGSARLDGSARRLHVPLPRDAAPDAVRARVERWQKGVARELLGARLAHFAPAIGIGPREWHLSNARTQWGSCTSGRVIRLNWRLVGLPPALIDYVVVHELAHLHELNHGARFWTHVGRVLPDYRDRRQRLAAMPEHLAL